jgi:branched-chain amino acid aminotransferase
MSKKLKTVGLLELTGSVSFDDEDLALKQTFEYYWKNDKKFGLDFEEFPICNTKGDVNLTLKLLNRFYKKGYRVFIGFSRSSILAKVLDWFKQHPDAVGISATSAAYSLAVKKNIYRMMPIDEGIQNSLEEDIRNDPTLKIYYLYEKDDVYSSDFLESFKKIPSISSKLTVCEFSKTVTTNQLVECLKDSRQNDRIINGLVGIDFLDIFKVRDYTIKPYIYDNIGSKHPEFDATQATNLTGKYSFFSYKGVNSSYLWRKGSEYLKSKNKKFSPLGLDVLQVNHSLCNKQNPNYLVGHSGVLQFHPVTKDRLYYSVTREDFKNNQWFISSLIFNDPIYKEQVSTPFVNNDCMCIQIYKPVKCNGKTYSNLCEAKCAGELEGNCIEIKPEHPPTVVVDNIKFFPYVWSNGNSIPFAEATVSVATHALQYGTGVFGGIRALLNPSDSNEILMFHLDRHSRMLSDAAKMIQVDISETAIRDAIYAFLNANKPTTSIYIRPLIYTSDLGNSPRLHDIKTSFIIYGMDPDYISSNEVVSCRFSSWTRQEDRGAKVTGRYITSSLAKTEAVKSGFDDAILLNARGKVCEASSSNIFIVRDNVLITPDVSENILEGVTRATVIELAKAMGIPVIERSVDKSELFIAQEVFLTETISKIVPVTRIENTYLPSARPVAKMLRKRFNEITKGLDPQYEKWITRVRFD